MRCIQLLLKRALDHAAGILGLLLLSIPFVTISLAIKLDSKGPVFFRQERVGKDGHSFKVWKFRKIVVGAVRKSLGYNVAKSVMGNLGLDELPQLINVLVGKMILIGPRPTLRYQVEHYYDFQ